LPRRRGESKGPRAGYPWLSGGKQLIALQKGLKLWLEALECGGSA
jgi:hypothetical protein